MTDEAIHCGQEIAVLGILNIWYYSKLLSTHYYTMGISFLYPMDILSTTSLIMLPSIKTLVNIARLGHSPCTQIVNFTTALKITVQIPDYSYNCPIGTSHKHPDKSYRIIAIKKHCILQMLAFTSLIQIIQQYQEGHL